MSRTTPLLAALETTWDAIRTHHPGLPPAVLRLSQGHDPRHPDRSIRGHWSPCTWQLGEVMLAGERLRDGAAGVLATVLHEAAHDLAHARGIQDTSRQGRHHNHRYRDIAGELLLDVSRDDRLGWTVSELSAAARERYAAALEELAGTVRLYRLTFTAAAGGVPPRPSRVKLACACRRSLYIAPGVAALGELAHEVLLDVTRSEQYGWSATGLSAAARERYREPLEELAGTLGVYRRTFAAATASGPPRRPSRVKLTCGCRRALYIAPGVAARGPILCGCCEEPFLPG